MFPHLRSFHRAQNALHSQTATGKHSRGCNPPSVLLTVTRTPLWWHLNKMMCPGRDTKISSEGITPCMAQSTWSTQWNTSHTPQNEQEVENLQSTEETSFCQSAHKCVLNVKSSERPVV